MSKKVLTVGEILVEIVATTKGDGFREPQPLVGPFPSGAPAIFIDQVGRLGTPAAIISRVGDDDFPAGSTWIGWRQTESTSRESRWRTARPRARPSSATDPTARAHSSTTSSTAPPASWSSPRTPRRSSRAATTSMSWAPHSPHPGLPRWRVRPSHASRRGAGR